MEEVLKKWNRWHVVRSEQMICLDVYQEPQVIQSYYDHFTVRSCNIQDCPYSTFSSNLITMDAMAPRIQMRCCVSPVPAYGGVFIRAASDQIKAATKSYCYHGTTLYTTNWIYDYLRACMVDVHKLFCMKNQLHCYGIWCLMFIITKTVHRCRLINSRLTTTIPQAIVNILFHGDNNNEDNGGITMIRI
jgi:hypothetical protein